MKHLIEAEAKEQLRLLKKSTSKARKKISGYFREDSYKWIAFDNRTGNMWVANWQSQGEALNWLDNDPG